MRPALDFAGWFVAGVAAGFAVYLFKQQRRHVCPVSYVSTTGTGSEWYPGYPPGYTITETSAWLS